MADTTNQSSKLDKAAVAKLVKRSVPILNKNKKPTGKHKLISVGEKEIFAFKEYADHVIVCTVDGVKLRGVKK